MKRCCGLVLVLVICLPAFAGQPVAVTPVFRYSNCAVSGHSGAVTFLDNAQAARQWIAKMQAQPLRSHSDTWVPKGMVFVGLSMGVRESTGYGLLVDGTAVLESDGTLLLPVRWAHPEAGAKPLKMRVSPCVLVGLPKAGYRRIMVVDQQGKVRLQKQRD